MNGSAPENRWRRLRRSASASDYVPDGSPESALAFVGLASGLLVIATPVGVLVGVFWSGLLINTILAISAFLGVHSNLGCGDSTRAVDDLTAEFGKGSIERVQGLSQVWKEHFATQQRLIRIELLRTISSTMVAIACLLGTLSVPVAMTTAGRFLITTLVVLTAGGHLVYGADWASTRCSADAPYLLPPPLVGFWTKLLRAVHLERFLNAAYQHSGLHLFIALVIASATFCGAIGAFGAEVGPGLGGTCARTAVEHHKLIHRDECAQPRTSVKAAAPQARSDPTGLPSDRDRPQDSQLGTTSQDIGPVGTTTIPKATPPLFGPPSPATSTILQRSPTTSTAPPSPTFVTSTTTTARLPVVTSASQPDETVTTIALCLGRSEMDQLLLDIESEGAPQNFIDMFEEWWQELCGEE